MENDLANKFKYSFGDYENVLEFNGDDSTTFVIIPKTTELYTLKLSFMVYELHVKFFREGYKDGILHA